VRVSADFGGQRDRFYVQLSDRRFLDSEFSLSATGYRSDVSYEDFEETSTGFDVSLGRSLDDAGQQRAFVRYGYTIREIDSDDDFQAASPIFRELLQDDTTTSLLGLAYRVDKRNDRVLATGGYEASFALDGAGLGGFTKFARAEARSAYYLGVPEWMPVPGRERSSFVFAGRIGYTLPFNDVSDFDLGSAPSSCFPGDPERCPLEKIDEDLELPLSERYFLGGIGSFQLRGYKARSVGPRRSVLYEVQPGLYTPVGIVNLGAGPVCQDPDGCNSLDDKDDDDFDNLDETDVVGGSQFVSLSSEYRFPISEQLGLIGIAFFDVGDAMAEDEFLFDVTEWRLGTGAGVLWFSPFGPLQAVLGFPLNALSVEDNMVFEFSVGGSAL
jgi:outer membrane protein insertion porin family